VLGPYVREKRTITLESAVHKMTAFPAQTLGLFDRGLLRPGMKADVVVFDPETVGDRGTYTEPFQYAVGIEHVLVNGRLTVSNGKHLGTKAGEVLRKSRV
jgi:N-acyl-D-aspartate/D-glutamate deacylase